MTDSVEEVSDDAVAALEMARDLIREAKGAEGPSGGFVTDHLDAAENWLDKVETALSRRAIANTAGETTEDGSWDELRKASYDLEECIREGATLEALEVVSELLPSLLRQELAEVGNYQKIHSDTISELTQAKVRIAVLMRGLEELAAVIGKDRETTGPVLTEIWGACLPVFTDLGMTDSGEGLGFDWDAPSAIASPPAGAGEPDFASSIRDVCEEIGSEDGACGWRSCTGCHETNEGYETGHYPFSEMFQCYVGAGCHECGGIGVVWEHWDKADLDAMVADLHPPQHNDVRVTDEMVEAAAKALYEDDDLWSASERPWPAKDAEIYRRLARAALTAALGKAGA